LIIWWAVAEFMVAKFHAHVPFHTPVPDPAGHEVKQYVPLFDEYTLFKDVLGHEIFARTTSFVLS
jgi:hypothetical protein